MNFFMQILSRMPPIHIVLPLKRGSISDDLDELESVLHNATEPIESSIRDAVDKVYGNLITNKRLLYKNISFLLNCIEFLMMI